MTTRTSMSFLFRGLLPGVLLASSCAFASAVDFTGRGLNTFDSGSGCPLGARSAAANQCNRLALDDDQTKATVDVAAHTIHFTNTHRYAGKTAVGDVLLQGTGLSATGQRVPLSFHLILSKSGDAWSLNSHAHAPVHGRFTDVHIDPYQIELSSGDASERVVVLPEQISKALSHPALAARLASQFVQVRDNRRGKAGDADITILVGAERVAIPVMRARLNLAGLQPGGLETLLQSGTWNVQLESLTGHIPDEVVQREMFLYGLDRQALLQPLMQRGFNKHDKLTMGAVDGKGYLRLGTVQQPFDGAAAATQSFLQQSFIGLVLGWQEAAFTVAAH